MSTQGEQTNLPPLRKKRRIHKQRALKVRTASIRSDINVTPLVDVVLVLLIIFMVVTPMITRGMPVEQPITINHDKKSDSGEQIVVSVTCEGGKMGPIHWECGQNRVYVATELASDDTIGELVTKEVRKGTGNREIHLKADRKVNYSAVRNVMERINAAGITTIALGSEELKKD
jgi:biopolymer transport protein TolR